MKLPQKCLSNGVGVYTIRYLGRESRRAILPDGFWVNANLFPTDLCWDLEVMEGKAKSSRKPFHQVIVQFNQQFFSRMKPLSVHIYIFHIRVLWIPAISVGIMVIRVG